MRRMIFVAVALATSLFAPLGAVVLPATLAPPTARADDGLIAPTPPPPRLPITSFDGAVTAVDDRSITIRGFNAEICNSAQSGCNEAGSQRWSAGPKMVVSFPDRDVPCIRVVRSRDTWTMTSPTGEVTVLRRADQPAQRFPVDEVLAAGGFRADLTAGSTYRLADVQIGDEVYIRLCRQQHDGLCYAISIRRRPGGRVPPAPGQGPNPQPWAFHERMNAEQDLEEKGIPIPAKFRPRFDPRLMERAARWKFGDPIPDELRPLIEPNLLANPWMLEKHQAARMPREVLPRIPPAK